MAKNYVTSFRGENFSTPAKYRVKDEPVTPGDEDFGDHDNLDYSFEHAELRKSLSMNDIARIREDFIGLDMQEKEVYQRYRRQRGAPEELSKTKFVSMAEAIYHFQRDTPGRFHSAKPRCFQSRVVKGPSGLTKPQSPILRCKARTRTVHVMSQKEKEEMELEEIKKFKIKAQPIPKSVLEGTNKLPEVTKKPVTVPEPFNLTEIQKKPMDTQDEQVHFKARPAPKHILEKPHVPPKPPVQITKPISPNLTYKRAKSNDQLKTPSIPIRKQKSAEKPSQKPVQRHGPIRPEPFSFEKRDEEMKKRREEMIKKKIEEERKQANLFKAQPLPGAVKKQMNIATAKGSSSTTSTSSENKENHGKFEARPALVLRKEPFKPVHEPQQQVKLCPFQLTTEKRAADREKFDQLLKKKEEEQERYRIQREKEQQELEEKAKAELRAKLVHHAKPVPARINNPFVPVKSVEVLTVPETPKFIRRMRQN